MKVSHRGAVRRGIVASALAAMLLVTAVAPGAAQSAKVKVKVGDNYFKPKQLTIAAGDTIVFKWIGTAIHDVVSKKPNPEKFKSDKQASGKYKRVLLAPGDYEIVCTLHPGMDMEITVTPPPPTTTSSTAPAAP